MAKNVNDREARVSIVRRGGGKKDVMFSAKRKI